MSEPNGEHADILPRLAFVARQLALADQEAEHLRELRDTLVLAAAEQGKPHADIAQAAEVGVKAIGNITRGAGLRRYRPRSETKP